MVRLQMFNVSARDVSSQKTVKKYDFFAKRGRQRIEIFLKYSG